MTTAPQLEERAAAVVNNVVTWTEDRRDEREDVLAVEEPLEIRLAGCSVAVTMRTPGNDFDLAAGFLYSEGIIHHARDIASMAYCGTDDAQSQDNILNLNPVDPDLVDPGRWQRNFYATSSCGVCGKASIEAVRQEAPPISSVASTTSRTLYRLSDALRVGQEVFGQTGGLHGAGLFDLQGQLLTVREDVGRHNAVDKVIGDGLRHDELPFSQRILLVSGRASFEIMQKALMAGVPIVAAVSAPSSLAVELAREGNVTLVGFLRSGRFNIYAGDERIGG